MKSVTYQLTDGTSVDVEYDEYGPCHVCGLPVLYASMGGTALCPWCDMGTCRFDRSHRVDGAFGGSEHYDRYHAAERDRYLAEITHHQQEST